MIPTDVANVINGSSTVRPRVLTLRNPVTSSFPPVPPARFAKCMYCDMTAGTRVPVKLFVSLSVTLLSPALSLIQTKLHHLPKCEY